MITHKTYTLDEARAELDRRECDAVGHDFDVVVAEGDGGPIALVCSRCGRSWVCHELAGSLRMSLEERIAELEAALRVAADDLGKAVNQFAAMRESQALGHFPPVERNPEIFAEKEARARAALEGEA